MLYITNPCKSWIPMRLLYPMWGSLLQCWPAGAINMELPLYGLPPTSFIRSLILPLTMTRNWNPCDNSHNSLAVKRTTSWPNPVESQCPSLQHLWHTIQLTLSPLWHHNLQNSHSNTTSIYCCAPWILCRYQVVTELQISDIFCKFHIGYH